MFLLNLLNESSKRDKMSGRAFYRLFATSLINSVIQKLKCQILISFVTEIILKHFGLKTSIFFNIYATLLWISFHNAGCRMFTNRSIIMCFTT